MTLRGIFSASFAVAVLLCTQVAFGQFGTNAPLAPVPPSSGLYNPGAPVITNQPIITGPPVVAGPGMPPPPPGAYDPYYSPGAAGPLVGPPSLGFPSLGFPSAGGPISGCDDSACGLPAFYAFVEFFDWEGFAKYSPLVIQQNPANEFTASSTDLSSDVGYRIGLGWRFGDGWDIGVLYTKFDTIGTLSFGDILPTADVNTANIIVPGQFGADAGQETLSLNYEVFDIEAGRKFCICKTLILRPSFSLRFANFGHSRATTYYEFVNAGANAGDPADDVVDVNRYTTSTSVDGIGPRIGSHVSWNIGGSGLQVFSRGGLSLLWSDISVRETFDDINDVNASATPDATFVYRENFQQMVPVADIAIGVRFEAGGFFISGGYEAQNWFNVVNEPTPSLFRSDFPVNQGDIGLGGYFIRAGYNY